MIAMSVRLRQGSRRVHFIVSEHIKGHGTNIFHKIVIWLNGDEVKQCSPLLMHYLC